MKIDGAAVHASPSATCHTVRRVHYAAVHGVARVASPRSYDAARGAVFEATTDLPRETAADLIYDVLRAWRPGGEL